MIQACSGCGNEFDTLAGKYAPDGSIVCAPCGEKLMLVARSAEKKSSSSAFPGSIGAVIIALMSFIVEHRVIFFLFPLLAIAAGGGTAYTALRNESARQALGWKRIPTVALGAIAVLLGLVSLILSFV
jgi:DNA-directed RNA polymerase subunit RPC12/RpoP